MTVLSQSAKVPSIPPEQERTLLSDHACEAVDDAGVRLDLAALDARVGVLHRNKRPRFSAAAFRTSVQPSRMAQMLRKHSRMPDHSSV